MSDIGNKSIQEDLEEFRALLKAEEKAFELQAQQEPDKEEEEEALSESTYVPEVPYVGMSENNSTRLGTASSTGHDNEMTSGQVVTANLYYYNVGDTTIFIVRCIDGKIAQVWDYRDKLTSFSSSASASISSAVSIKSDLYNI